MPPEASVAALQKTAPGNLFQQLKSYITTAYSALLVQRVRLDTNHTSLSYANPG